jgi:UDP-glucose 4-epimerase
MLLKDGHDVIAVDNLRVGREKNLSRAREFSNFDFAKMDICELSPQEPKFVSIDWVFHLAGLADIVPSIESPDEYFRTNVVGTYNVVRFAEIIGAKKFIYSASSSCYGLPDHFPTTEEATCKPEYPYALTKYLGEQVVLHWSKVFNVPSVSLRLFNVYGPRARTSGSYGAVFGVFLAQKLAGLPFTVVGDGTQTRDFTFVTDVCRALLMAAKSSLNGEVFNVGSGSTYEVKKLVEILGGPVEYIPKRPGEPDSTFADISKIRKKLSWEPQITFEKGVSIMLEHIDDWKDAPVWDSRKIEQATRSWFTHLNSRASTN